MVRLITNIENQCNRLIQCIDMKNIEQNIDPDSVYTFPGSETTHRDILIRNRIEEFEHETEIDGLNILNYNDDYDYDLNVLSDTNIIKFQSVIHQYDEQLIGIYVTKNEINEIKKMMNENGQNYRNIGITRISNSINQISYNELIDSLIRCTDNQIITCESVFKRLCDIFQINKSVNNFVNTFGIELLKHMISDYMDIYNIKQIITSDTLNKIRTVINDKNISIRNIFLLNCDTRDTVTRQELIKILELYQIETYYQILDDVMINVHWDIFYPLESYDYPMCIIIPSYNNINTFANTLNSIYDQSYNNYRIIYIDDLSENHESDMVRQYIEEQNQNNRTILISQKKRQRQCAGRFIGYHMTYDDEIVIFVDGDDKLNKNALNIVNQRYSRNDVILTYGCYNDVINGTMDNNLKGNERFPDNIMMKNDYRKYKFITTHLRTGFGKLFKSIELNDLLDDEKEFCHVMSDYVEMIPSLEMATYKPNTMINNIYFDIIPVSLYMYNVDNSKKYVTSFIRRNEPNNHYKQYRIQIDRKIKNSAKYESLIMCGIDKIECKINIINDSTKISQHIKYHNDIFSHHLLIHNDRIITDQIIDTLSYLVNKYSFYFITYDPLTNIYTGYHQISDIDSPTIFLTGVILNHKPKSLHLTMRIRYKYYVTKNNLMNHMFILIKNSMLHLLQ
jgi:glycosyltransferase involved in cell wall biosynthesis